MAKTTLMIASLLAATSLFGQGPAVGTATARVRIISQAAWQPGARGCAPHRSRRRAAAARQRQS